MARVVIAVLALLVAAQYAFIALYILPRLARLAAKPSLGVVRAAQAGAAVFFLGCGITHVGIAVHTLFEPDLAPQHLLVVHLWPHLAQIIGGATFSYIAWKRLDVRFSPKGHEQERERLERERQRAAEMLAKRAAEQEAVARLGQLALQATEVDRLLDATVDIVAKVLDVELCKVLEMSPCGEQLTVIAGVGWRPDVVGRAVVPVRQGSQAGFTLHAGEAVVVDDLVAERRFRGHGLLHDHGVVSGMTVVIGGRERPFGVLGIHTPARRRFSDHEVNFLTSIANVLATAIDRAASDVQSRHRALHDALTQLPNRALFLDRLGHSLERLARRPATVAVLFFDLDEFKAVNDVFGHPAGDRLLAAVAARLAVAVRSGETLARFGGDEFAILLEGLDDGRDAITVAQRVADTLKAAFVIDGTEHFVSASIGIAVADSPDVDREALLRDADVAMYRAKANGRARFELFDEDLRERALTRLRLETALRSALERDQMHLVYQPVVSPGDGAMVGVEALLRWDHPDFGPVSPVDFIPIAERTGLIIPIGRWVLAEACRQAARWRTAAGDGRPLKVSVNVSAHQLCQQDFADDVVEVIREAEIDPGQLALEITESVLIQAAGSPLDTLHRLREAGVDIVLDDFGTGYSSLGYIDRFPLDAIKLDRTFVAGLDKNRTSPAIFAAVVTMANALDLPVIAEGVETEEQALRVQALGCALIQGYFYGRPVPPEEITRALNAGAIALP